MQRSVQSVRELTFCAEPVREGRAIADVCLNFANAGAALHEGEQAKSRADGLESELRRSGAKVGSLEEQVAHGLQVAEASNKDAENAFIEVQRLQAQLANAEQALAASHGDTSALRERLKEDARARAEHEVSATRAMEEILLERESERERETEERAKALAQLQATHDKAIQVISIHFGSRAQYYPLCMYARNGNLTHRPV